MRQVRAADEHDRPAAGLAARPARRSRPAGRPRPPPWPASRGPRCRPGHAGPSRARKPETPRATSVMPRRQGRPKESLTTTPTSTPSSSRMALRRPAAERSGSSGSSVTTSPSPTLEASTPALAQTKPWCVRLMMTPCSMRTISADSRSTTSTCAGVLVPGPAHSSASGRGSTLGQAHDAALGLGDDLLGDHQHVAGRGRQLGVLGDEPPPGLGDEAAQVIARADLRQLRQGHREQPTRSSLDPVDRGAAAAPVSSRSRAGSSRSRSSGVSRSKPSAGSLTTCTAAPAASAARRWASKLSGPKAGAMTSGRPQQQGVGAAAGIRGRDGHQRPTGGCDHAGIGGHEQLVERLHRRGAAGRRAAPAGWRRPRRARR